SAAAHPPRAQAQARACDPLTHADRPPAELWGVAWSGSPGPARQNSWVVPSNSRIASLQTFRLRCDGATDESHDLFSMMPNHLGAREAGFELRLNEWPVEVVMRDETKDHPPNNTRIDVGELTSRLAAIQDLRHNVIKLVWYCAIESLYHGPFCSSLPTNQPCITRPCLPKVEVGRGECCQGSKWIATLQGLPCGISALVHRLIPPRCGDSHIQVVLATKIVVDHPLADVRALYDLSDTCPSVPTLSEDDFSRVEEPLAGEFWI